MASKSASSPMQKIHCRSISELTEVHNKKLTNLLKFVERKEGPARKSVANAASISDVSPTKEMYQNVASILDTLQKMKDSRCKFLEQSAPGDKTERELETTISSGSQSHTFIPHSNSQAPTKPCKRIGCFKDARVQKKLEELRQRVHTLDGVKLSKSLRRNGCRKENVFPAGSASAAVVAARRQSHGSRSAYRLLQPEEISSTGLTNAFAGGELRLGQPASLQLVENLLQLEALVTATACGVVSNNEITITTEKDDIENSTCNSTIHDIFGSRPSTEESSLPSPSCSSVMCCADDDNDRVDVDDDLISPLFCSSSAKIMDEDARLLLPESIQEKVDFAIGEELLVVNSMREPESSMAVESEHSELFSAREMEAESSVKPKPEVSFQQQQQQQQQQQPSTLQRQPHQTVRRKRAHSAGPYHRGLHDNPTDRASHLKEGAKGTRRKRQVPKSNTTTNVINPRLQRGQQPNHNSNNSNSSTSSNPAAVKKKKRRAKSARVRRRRVELTLTEEQIEAMPMWVIRHIIANLSDIRPEHYSLLLRLSDDDVRKPHATEEQIAALPTTTATDAQEREKQACVICMEAYAEGQSLTLLPLCNHSFHTECVVEYFERYNSACPLCKKKIET